MGLVFENSENIDAIKTLLKKSDLPYSDIPKDNIKFIANVEEGILNACIAVESFGTDGLLRSFALKSSQRNCGVGSKLLNTILERNKGNGIRTLHLLTTTADQYFLKKGFKVGDRSHAPKAIKATTEFSELCPASSVYMTFKIQ